MCCFYHTSNTINLVTASVDASVGIVEHTIFIPDVVDGRAPTHGVIFAKYVPQITKQQGRYAVGHDLSPLAIRSRGRNRPRCLDARVEGKLQRDAVSVRNYRSSQVRGAPPRTAFISFVDFFEVEIGKIHVAERQYVDGEDILPFAQTDFEKLRSQVPMVPLTPSQRVCRIICGGDLQRSGCVVAIHID